MATDATDSEMATFCYRLCLSLSCQTNGLAGHSTVREDAGIHAGHHAEGRAGPDSGPLPSAVSDRLEFCQRQVGVPCVEARHLSASS